MPAPATPEWQTPASATVAGTMLRAEPERDDSGPGFADAPSHAPWAASTPHADLVRHWHDDDLAEIIAARLHDAADLRGVDR